MQSDPKNPPQPPACPQCGQPIPPDAPDGLCPQCVLRGAVQSPDAAPRESPMEPSLGSVREAFPELEVVGRIGAGGMGVVFKARQPGLDRWVALKVLPTRLAADPAFVERFQREARLLARLSHPGIVAVHAYGQAGPYCYLLLEYVDGVNLRQAMQAGRFTPSEALALVPRICEALQYAHDHGVLHRDIKPENILLDTAGRVKIADFGIAKLVDDPRADITLTESGARLGTPHYMAPEQVEDPARVDHRADVYSLGVVFYELLTGELPLGRFAPPSAKATLDARIDEIVLRALAKERELRQQSAGEVKTQVEDVARNPDGAPQPPTAAPPPPSASRLNWAAALTGLSLVLAVPPLTALGWILTGQVANVGISGIEVFLSVATQVPALILGVAGFVLAARQVRTFRQVDGPLPGFRRMAFALGAWPALVLMTAAAVLAGGGMLAGTNLIGRASTGGAAAAALGAVLAVSGVLPVAMWRLIRGHGRPDWPVRVPTFQWLLHAGLAGLFLLTFSGVLSAMILRDPQRQKRLASRPVADGWLMPVRIEGSPTPPVARLELPPNRIARITARLWSNQVALPHGTLTFEIPPDGDRPLVAQIAWSNGDAVPGNADPGWVLLVTDSRGRSRHPPPWVEGQPTRWKAGTMEGWLDVVPDPGPAAPSTPVLFGSGSGASGPVPWFVTLEATWLPAPPGGLATEIHELTFAREQLRELRQRAVTGLIPARGREVLDAEYRVAVARALVDRRPADVTRATLDHARAVLALTEEEFRLGTATADDLNRARASFEKAAQAAGPAAGSIP